jgi:hypothetical protein
VNQEAVQPQQEWSPHDAAPTRRLIHLALPVRLIHKRTGEPDASEFACTYDIHPRGARLLSTREVKVGDLMTVERGRNKSICQVVWTANPESPLRGQFTVECLESGRTPWEEELRQMTEQYWPVIAEKSSQRCALNTLAASANNRRRAPRFRVEGGADIAEIGGVSRVGGRLEQISESGCLIRAGEVPMPGKALRLVLNMCDVSIALRGQVRYTANSAMGVQFHDIRQGDRPLLEHVLTLLKKPRREDFADLEVITEDLKG